MRLHRIHTEQPLEPEHEIRLENDRAHYLGRVLRVAAGQTIVLFNGDGCDYAAEVLAADRNTVRIAVRSRLPARRESPLAITIVQAVSRGERMDQTLQKCTELGATAFRPVLSERVEVRLDGKRLAKRLDHWRSVIVAACEQSGRARIPELAAPGGLDAWPAESDPAATTRLVLDPDADRRLADVPAATAFELAVGPEGGFSAAEVDRMDARGVVRVTLGPRILRTETAAPAAIAVLQALHGDF
ncbi:MAG: 16S rRNA (uracil(1498)-N(3))-methyltransferase [Xanthomonadales bacterium]